MIRKIPAALAAAVLTASVVGVGIVAGGGVAGAAKPVLNGTLTCKSASATTINPPLVLSIPPKNGKPGKDKAAKYTSTGTISQCTGTATSGTSPTAGTTTAKSKGTGHTCGSIGGNGTTTSTKITFNNGAKLKASATITGAGLFDPSNQTFTALPTDKTAAQTLILQHQSSRLQFTLSATSLGKAYAGRHLATKVVTTENMGTLFVAGCTGSGVKGFHADPTYSTFKIT